MYVLVSAGSFGCTVGVKSVRTAGLEKKLEYFRSMGRHPDIGISSMYYIVHIGKALPATVTKHSESERFLRCRDL